MNNEIFDRMIKENLQEMQVAPSAGVKKALGWKLFFQNLLVFHKIKLALGVLAITGTSALYIALPDLSDESLLSHIVLPSIKAVPIEDQFTDEIIVKQEVKSIAEENNAGFEPSSNAKNKEQNSAIITNESNVNNSNDQFIAEEETTKESSDEMQENQQTVSAAESKSSNSGVKVDNLPIEDKGVNEEESTATMVSQNNESLNVEEEGNASSDMEQADLFLAEPNGVDLVSEASLITPQEAEDIELNFAPGVYQELSFDAYKGLMGQSEIQSELESVIHQKYYWDFHGNNDVLDMNVLAGVNVNYSIGARIFRLKANTGISYFTINDTKAVYEFEEITDPAWLSFFNTDELAWVNTYGEDTCTQCFYAHNTEELQTELKKEYNQYSYIKVPLQLGAQFNFKYVSLDVLGGVDMNFLTKSQGLYVKEGLNPNYERFYYWDDLQLSTLSKGNEMMKKNFMTWSVAANFRVRLTRQLDLLAGYQINKSFGSLTNDDYIMAKTLKSSNASVGITFYPNRSALKPKFLK